MMMICNAAETMDYSLIPNRDAANFLDGLSFPATICIADQTISISFASRLEPIFGDHFSGEESSKTLTSLRSFLPPIDGGNLEDPISWNTFSRSSPIQPNSSVSSGRVTWI